VRVQPIARPIRRSATIRSYGTLPGWPTIRTEVPKAGSPNACGQCPTHPRTGGVRKRYGVSQCESESITPGRPVARSHRDRRSAGRRSGVVSAYILNKNPSASSNSVKTASPCRGTFQEKYSATYVLKSSISSIVSMEPRKDWSGLYSRACIPESFYSLQPTAGGWRRLMRLAKSGSRGTRADQGVRPTIYAGFSVSGKLNGIGAAGSRSAGRRGSLQSLLELSPCVPQLGSTIEDQPLGLR
jgi:hypothetical protein